MNNRGRRASGESGHGHAAHRRRCAAPEPDRDRIVKERWSWQLQLLQHHRRGIFLLVGYVCIVGDVLSSFVVRTTATMTPSPTTCSRSCSASVQAARQGNGRTTNNHNQKTVGFNSSCVRPCLDKHPHSSSCLCGGPSPAKYDLERLRMSAKSLIGQRGGR